MSGQPWGPGEQARYSACGRHAGALERLGDFDAAFDRAQLCEQDGGGCVTEVRPQEFVLRIDGEEICRNEHARPVIQRLNSEARLPFREAIIRYEDPSA